MKEIEKSRLDDLLPERVVNSLYEIADKYRGTGVRLFIFGSFAKSGNRFNSDLDIGIEWTGKRSKELYRQIRSDIWDLPTVRKVDLVDMSQVSPSFVAEAEKDRMYLN